MIKDYNALWVQVLAGKYVRHDQVVSTDIKHIKTASNAWNGMAQAKYIIDKGSRLRVGNGKHVQFLLDKWLMNEPLINLILAPIDLAKQYRVVRDYWSVDEGWAWLSLEALLPSSTLDKLATIILVDIDDNLDEITWDASANGKFTVSSAYE